MTNTFLATPSSLSSQLLIDRVILADNCIIVYITAMWVICLTYYPRDITHCSWRIYRMASEYQDQHSTMCHTNIRKLRRWWRTSQSWPWHHYGVLLYSIVWVRLYRSRLHWSQDAMPLNICIGKHFATIYLICGIDVVYDIFINLFWNNCEIGLKRT